MERGVARLIDAYAGELLEKSEFEPRLKALRERVNRAEAELSAAEEHERYTKNIELVLARLEDFTEQVRGGLETADWKTRREVIRAIVERIEMDHENVRVVYRVDPRPFVDSPRNGGVLQLRTRRGDRDRDRRLSPARFPSLAPHLLREVFQPC